MHFNVISKSYCGNLEYDESGSCFSKISNTFTIIQKVVFTVYKRDKLFSMHVGREFQAFPGYVHKYSVSQKELLKLRMEKYAWKLDAEKLVMDVHE